RRAVLSGAIGALFGLVTSAVARPPVADAGSDGDVVLGAMQGSGSTTQIFSSTIGVFDGPVIRGDATHANANAGVLGTMGAALSDQPLTPGGVVGISQSLNPTTAPGVVGHGSMTVGSRARAR